MRKCLVTGGAGFIGSHLADALVERGDQVAVLDNFSTGRRENLAGFRGKVVEGDLNDANALSEAMTGAEVVFHLAARASVPRSIAEPMETNRANTDGTVAVLWAAKERGVRRVVYSASSSAYGNSPHFPRVETLLPEPLSPYAVSKLAGELYCRAFSECYGLQTVSLRYFNIFGPRQDPNSQYAAAIPKFVTAIMEDHAPVVYGDGEQSRDFTYVANAVQANVRAADADGVSGMMFNVGVGRAVTINEVIRQINEALDRSVRPEYRPARAGDVRHSHADISLAREKLGYEPAVTFEQGLSRTIQYFSKLHAAQAKESRSRR